MRVVSLLPAATEIICALGAGDRLVGRSHECDFPEHVRGLPVLTRERLHLTGPSAAIDEQVRSAVERALALYEVDVEGLQRAEPDVIVTQDLCDVCALGKDSLLSSVRHLIQAETRVVSLGPTRLGEVWEDVRAVALALELPAAGERLVASLRSRLEQLSARSASASPRPTLLSIEWLDPIMIGGLWLPELIEIAGGRPLVTSPGQPAPTLTESELAALGPDVVLIKPCGFDRQRAALELSSIARRTRWNDWLDAPGRRVYVADGSAYFNRSGPRLLESAEILAACLYPSRFGDLAARHAGAFERYITPTA
jgi:iron complex transport system substrate-binding protein